MAQHSMGPGRTRRGGASGAWLVAGGLALALLLAGCSSGDSGASGGASGGGEGGGLASNSGLGGNVPIGPSAQPVVMADLLDAYVPESCGHGPGNLVNGELLGIESGYGEVQIATAPTDRSETLVAFGDLTGDGVDDAAVAIVCSKGGVGWPPLIQLYTDGGEWLGGVNLADTPGGGGRGAPETISIEDGQVHASWHGYYDGDGGANTMRQLTGVFSWDGNAVVVEDVQG